MKTNPGGSGRAPQLGRGAEYNPLGRFEEAGNTRELLSTGRRSPPVQYPELPLPEDNHVEPNTHSTRRSTPPSAPHAAAQGVCRRPSRDMQASATHFAAPTIADLDINNRIHPLGARKSPTVTRVPAQVNDLNMARNRVLLAESPPASHTPAPLPRLRPSQLVAANTHATRQGHGQYHQYRAPHLEVQQESEYVKHVPPIPRTTVPASADTLSPPTEVPSTRHLTSECITLSLLLLNLIHPTVAEAILALSALLFLVPLLILTVVFVSVMTALHPIIGLRKPLVLKLPNNNKTLLRTAFRQPSSQRICGSRDA